MTREEAKQLLPIIQSFAEGEIIECRTKPGTISAGIPNKWTEIKEIGFWNGIEYRIKPDPKYRPFKDAEECWKEMQKHQPFGWLKDKNGGHRTLITVVDNEDMMALNGITGWDFLSIMNMYVFADGTPFGVKIEKEE
jgi:hypothetical protein